MNPRSLLRYLVIVVGWAAVGIVMPYLIGTGPAKVGQLEYIEALMMVACGLLVVLGYAGQLFLGPSALFAAGGYTAAVLAEHTTLLQSLPAMCLVSIVAAVVLAALAAIPALRIGGFYLGMVTLFAALVVPAVASHLSLTGGGNGISLEALTSFVQKPSGLALYDVGILLVALMAGYAWIIKHSRLGRRFGAIMAGEDLAQAVGVRPYQTKLTAFILAAVPCGVAGAFYVYSQQFISPDSVTPLLSVTILAGMVVGGAGTVIGPIIGTALVGAASQFMGAFEKYQGLVYGVALIGVATGLPYGLTGLYQGVRYKLRGVSPMAPDPVVVRRVREAAAVTGAEDAPAAGAGLGPGGGLGPPLVVRGVERSFGGVRALGGVDLEVERGSVHALVGPNGSGKTTLLNLITGYYRTEAGTISLGDDRLDTRRGPEIAGLGIARTFQTPKLLVAGNALANVVVAADRAAGGSLAGTVLHTRRARSEDRRSEANAARALARLGLMDDCFTMAELIPHGTQRLLEIARATALRPRFVLLDEPAAGLSAAEAELLKQAVRDLARRGVGVLIVEHNLPVVFDLADIVTVLHQGRVIAVGTPAEVAASPEVVRVYIGRQRTDPAAPPAAAPARGRA